MKSLQRYFGRHTDIALVMLVMGVLFVLFAPIPKGLLDFLLLTNFSFALLILLLTFYTAKPVEFSTFPSLLLIATLFRLSLNVAATRLILSEGDAGHVIGAVGAYVVGGNYVIGFIVFLILVIVQYVVVTNGAQRVSEVAARFTLDSMPGQQMSIDAELNMGLIDQAEAHRRRKHIEREAAFYGAMDGASKFVKGDAVAGILIMLINIIGGLVIGVMQMQLSWPEALQKFTLLTVGDGIVTQVPALIISVGTGIIVTRSASDAQLSDEVFKQLSAYPKTILIATLVLLGLLALPGLPTLPLLILILLLGTSGLLLRRVAKTGKTSTPPASTPGLDNENPAQGQANIAFQDIAPKPVELWLGRAWEPWVQRQPELLTAQLQSIRQKLAQEFGVITPAFSLAIRHELKPTIFELHIHGMQVGRMEGRLDHIMVVAKPGQMINLPGDDEQEPNFGLPVRWVDPSQYEQAVAAGHTVVEPITLLITRTDALLRQNLHTLFTRSLFDQVLEAAQPSHGRLLEEIMPGLLSAAELQKVFQGLLAEQVSIRHLTFILETLADAARHEKAPEALIEHVRRRLGPMICKTIIDEDQCLHAMVMDPMLEMQLLRYLRHQQTGATGTTPAPGSDANADVDAHHSIDPAMLARFTGKLINDSLLMAQQELQPVLVVVRDIRRLARELTVRHVTNIIVISFDEIPSHTNLKVFENRQA